MSAWIDTTGDAGAGSSFAHAPEDAPGSCTRGIGRKNLQLLVLTPDGEIVHAVGGFVPRDELLRELEWAIGTFEAVETTDQPAARVVVERQRKLLAADAERRKAETSERAGEPDSQPTAAEFLRDHRDRAVERDRKFVMEHPLLHVDRYETSMLGRGGADFFGSSSGTRPTERLGDDDGVDPLKRIEELRRRRDREEDPREGPTTR